MIRLHLIGIAILGFLVLNACTKQEPEVRTVTVEKAVPVPCAPKLPQRPNLLTREQLKVAVQGAATFDDRLKVAMEQLFLYMGWLPVVEGGLAGCSAVPSG